MKKQFQFDEYLQKVIPTDEIELIQKKLSYITPTNKRAATYLGFTRVAQISMAAFSDDAIKYAALNTKKHLLGEERFEDFHKLCKLYYTQHKIPYNPELQQQLHKLFKTDIKAPKVKLRTIVIPTRVQQPKKEKSYTRYDYKMKQGGD